MKFRHTPQVFKHQPQNLRKNFFLFFFCFVFYYFFVAFLFCFKFIFFIFNMSHICSFITSSIFLLLEHDRSKTRVKARISLLLSTGRRDHFALWVTRAVTGVVAARWWWHLWHLSRTRGCGTHTHWRPAEGDGCAPAAGTMPRWPPRDAPVGRRKGFM